MATLHYVFHAGHAPLNAEPALVIATITATRRRLSPAPLGGRDAARQRALAAALRRALPGLRDVRGGGRRGALELALPPAGAGSGTLRIALHAAHADVVVSVARHDPRLRDAFARAWTALGALDAAGLRIYDPQRVLLVDLAHDFEPIVGQFQEVAEAPRPWWKLW